MPRRAPADGEVAVQQLRTHAFALFGRYGYEGVSVADIAKQSGLSKSALYWHFANKEELYADCLARLFEIYTEDIFRPMDAAPDGVAAVMSMFVGMARVAQDERLRDGATGYWLGPASVHSERIDDIHRAYLADAKASVERALRRAEAEGALRLPNDIAPVARALLSAVESSIMPMRRLSTAERHEQLSVLCNILLRAYAAHPLVGNLTIPMAVPQDEPLPA